MPDVLVRDVLIRNVPIAALDKIKARARRQNRSLQSEMAIIIRKAADQAEPMSDLEIARKIKASILNRDQDDSVELLREDRAR
ncbi:MAG: hypothetical protein ABIP78_04080 [Pyrinomonadaceae bacterium]